MPENYVYLFEISQQKELVDFKKELNQVVSTKEFSNLVNNFKLVLCYYENRFFLVLYGYQELLEPKLNQKIQHFLNVHLIDAKAIDLTQNSDLQSIESTGRTRRLRSLAGASKRLFSIIDYAKTELIPIVGDIETLKASYIAASLNIKRQTEYDSPQSSKLEELSNRLSIAESEREHISQQLHEVLKRLNSVEKLLTKKNETETNVNQQIQNNPIETNTSSVQNKSNEKKQEEMVESLEKANFTKTSRVSISNLSQQQLDVLKEDFYVFKRHALGPEKAFFEQFLGNQKIRGFQSKFPFVLSYEATRKKSAWKECVEQVKKRLLDNG